MFSIRLSVCLSVRAYMRAQWSHSPTGLPSISSYFIYIFMQADSAGYMSVCLLNVSFCVV